MLTDKVYWLLEQGLNDAVGGWNEAKASEFQKYTKAQKRASRKTKRAKKSIPDSVENITPSESISTEIAQNPDTIKIVA